MIRISLYGFMLVIVSGCSITQTVEPVSQVATNQVCIIENPPVKEGVLAEIKSSLYGKNADVRVLGAGGSVADCPLVMTYVARWSWDLTIYMSYLEINVFTNGAASGRALYDARSGGGRLDKFVDAEPKIRELMDELFPAPFPALSGSEVIPKSESAGMAKGEDRAAGNDDAPQVDLYNRLLELEDLRDRRVLTEEEFQVQKKKLLDAT